MDLKLNVPKSKNKMTALVVDDNAINRRIHQKLLDIFGVENQIAGNGKEAVEIYSSGKTFDLVLMDLEMPIMNGIEATRKIRNMGIHSMIVGVSSRSSEQDKQEFIQAGLDDYEEKPLDNAKLRSIISRMKLEC